MSEELNSPQPSDPSPQEESVDASKLEASAALKTHPSSLCFDATRGVRVSRGGGAEALCGAAERAAQSGRRNDVQEYMRLRRGYV